MKIILLDEEQITLFNLLGYFIYFIIDILIFCVYLGKPLIYCKENKENRKLSSAKRLTEMLTTSNKNDIEHIKSCYNSIKNKGDALGINKRLIELTDNEILEHQKAEK